LVSPREKRKKKKRKTSPRVRSVRKRNDLQGGTREKQKCLWWIAEQIRQNNKNQKWRKPLQCTPKRKGSFWCVIKQEGGSFRENHGKKGRKAEKWTEIKRPS